MKSYTADTSDEAHARHIANIRAMTPAQRLAAAADLSRRALTQAVWVIRQRQPELPAREVQLLLLRRLYGRHLAEQVRTWSSPSTERTMPNATLYDAIEPLIAFLEALDLGHYIGGSVASISYGVPRSTMDVDIAVQMTRRDVPVFVQQLSPQYYLDAASMREAVTQRGSFNLIPLYGAVKIDVFVPPQTPFFRSLFERVVYRQPTQDAPRPYCLPSPEDVLLLKLQWYHLGNRVSERQRNDIIGVIQVQAGALDLRYIRRWAATLDVADVFEQLLLEADL